MFRGDTDVVASAYTDAPVAAKVTKTGSSVYRLPDIEPATGRLRLTLGASNGACLDALLLLPQNAGMDRAAMNLLQNWNYAPWDNPR